MLFRMRQTSDLVEASLLGWAAFNLLGTKSRITNGLKQTVPFVSCLLMGT